MGKKWRELRREKELTKREAKELTYPKRFRGKKRKKHGRAGGSTKTSHD